MKKNMSELNIQEKSLVKTLDKQNIEEKMYLTRWLFRRTRSFTSSQLIVVLRACLEKNLSYYCHLRKNSITILFFIKSTFFIIIKTMYSSLCKSLQVRCVGLQLSASNLRQSCNDMLCERQPKLSSNFLTGPPNREMNGCLQRLQESLSWLDVWF